MEGVAELRDIKMYIFVNNSLGMGKGKIGAQIGHVVCDITTEILIRSFEGEKRFLKIRDDFTTWRHIGQVKIVLKATQEEMDILKNLPDARPIYDAGHTQIEAGSLTVVGFFPVSSQKFSLPQNELKKYKLL